MVDISQLQQLEASQNYARLTSDVELPVDMTDTITRVSRVDFGHVYKNGIPTKDIKTQESFDEATGEVVTQVQVGVTVEISQGGTSAPIVFPKKWMSVDDAVGLVNAAKNHSVCTITGLRAVPFVEHKQKKDSNFVSSKPSVKWVCDVIEV